MATKEVRFSNDVLELIFDEMIKRDENGCPKSLAKVCGTNGIPPYNEVMRWFRPSFKHHQKWMEFYEDIKRVQTEIKVDTMDEIRVGAVDKDSAIATKVQLDQIKWEAQKILNERYSTKFEGRGKRQETVIKFKKSKKDDPKAENQSKKPYDSALSDHHSDEEEEDVSLEEISS